MEAFTFSRESRPTGLPSKFHLPNWTLMAILSPARLFQHRSRTAYISGVYGLSLTTRPPTSTQAWALNGICCAPITNCADTLYFFRRQAVAADRCKQSASFQYQMQAISIAEQMCSTASGPGVWFPIGYLRT